MSYRGVIAILAGGQGTRLWPLSTPERPKQFVPLFDGQSMLQLTFRRAADLVGATSVVLVGSAHHEALYFEQLPDLPKRNLILEPEGRGTAAAVLLTACVCQQQFPGYPVATIPADHIIVDSETWQRDIVRGLDFAQSDRRIVCLGVQPKAGETKFGYMKTGKLLAESVRNAEQFVEKPDVSRLDALISSGACLRNMGTLMFMAGDLKDEVRLHLPGTHDMIVDAYQQSEATLREVYPSVPSCSIDKSVLQHSDRVAVVASVLDSIDAGDFVTLGDAIGRDNHGNATSGNFLALDSTGNTVISEGVTVTLLGIDDLVVLADDDRILICRSDQVGRIKELQKNSE